MHFSTEEVPGNDAIRTREEHRSRYTASGLYPFLIGGKDDLQQLEEQAEFCVEDAASILRASLEITIAEWIAGRREEDDEDEELAGEILGEWPGEVVEKGSIGIHRDLLSGRVKPVVFLGLVRIESPWHLPAIMKYGSWNGCPAPEVHCAFQREWQDRFGAEIIGMSGDVVECRVSRPPTDREAATRLAWEQYGYCGDIVMQGCGSISRLAATLLNSPYWYFWWD